MYEEKYGVDNEIVRGLWGVINRAWDLYGETEVVS